MADFLGNLPKARKTNKDKSPNGVVGIYRNRHYYIDFSIQNTALKALDTTATFPKSVEIYYFPRL